MDHSIVLVHQRSFRQSNRLISQISRVLTPGRVVTWKILCRTMHYSAENWVLTGNYVAALALRARLGRGQYLYPRASGFLDPRGLPARTRSPSSSQLMYSVKVSPSTSESSSTATFLDGPVSFKALRIIYTSEMVETLLRAKFRVQGE